MGVLSSEPHEAPRLVLRCNIFGLGEKFECDPAPGKESTSLVRF